MTHEKPALANLRLGSWKPYVASAIIVPVCFAIIYGITWALGWWQLSRGHSGRSGIARRIAITLLRMLALTVLVLLALPVVLLPTGTSVPAPIWILLAIVDLVLIVMQAVNRARELGLLPLA